MNAVETPSARRCLRAVTPYSPGKSIASVRRELGLKKVVKLASNENPLGSSGRAAAAYRKAAGVLRLYPEGGSPELRQALARFHGVEFDRVLAGNGSDEIIRLLCEAFIEPEDEVILSQYGFIRFKQQAAMMGARIIEVPMVDWTYDLKTMLAAVSPRTKLLFIANPNNPTGTYNNEGEILELLGAVPSSVLVVLDEAYCQYAREWGDYPDSVPGLLDRHENLVVLRTFSKVYGLAGLRAGYALASPEVIGWLDRIRMPFNVSLPAQEACVLALKDEAFVRRSVALVSKERPWLCAALRDLGFAVEESAANFLFARSPIPGRELFSRLLKLGVIIRPLDEYGLAQNVRITIGTRPENQALLACLKKI
ncbi:MAG: histidinol-phosphate transaminase [Elusimicrobia bacterium]|nr:histidinol-phosphate transaminase [Elusimicrobiota bacterium]